MSLDPRYNWFSVKLVRPPKKTPQEYVFRGLTAKEIQVIAKLPTFFDAQKYALQTCVIYDGDWDKNYGWVCQTLSDKIWEFSGLTEGAKPYREAVEWIQHDVGKMEANAIAMIPGLTLEILENADPRNYAKYLLIGKHQFESLYNIPLEQAYANGQQEGEVAQVRHLSSPVEKGQVGTQVAEFSWKKGQFIDPNLSSLPD